MDSDAPPIVEDQPAEANAPTGQVEEPTFAEGHFDPTALSDELQPAYKQMQSAFTRKTQELAEQRKEAQAAMEYVQALQSDDSRGVAIQQLAEAFGEQAVLEALGYDIEGNPDEPVDDSPRDPRVDQLIERLEAERAEAVREAELDQLDQHVSSQLDALSVNGKPLSDRTQKLVLAHAIATYPPGEDGMPQIEAAWNDYLAEQDEWKTAWTGSKNSPVPPAPGVTGDKTVDLNDPEQRVNYLASVIADSSRA